MIRRYFRSVSAAVAAIAFIAGCAGQSPLGTTNGAAQAVTTAGSQPRPQATGKGLLFVASGNNSAIINFSGKVIRGFYMHTTNLCSTKQGYVLMPYQNEVVVFGHLGNTVRKLAAGFMPRSCATDPATNDVAVISKTRGGGGELALFHGDPRGTAKFLKDDQIATYGQCGYDSNSNLYFGGTDQAGNGYIAELPAGSKTFVNYPIAAGLDPFGTLQWDGTHMTITNPAAETISRLSFKNQKVAVVATIQVSGWNPVYDGKWPYVQTLILNGQFMAEVSKGTLGYWAYPDGGAPVSTSARFFHKDEHVYGIAYSIATP